jgi:hypothetical protein
LRSASTLRGVSYTNADGRRQLLDALGEATDHLGAALAQLGVAYEALDEHSGDRLEEALFRPVQQAYGRAQRTHGDFAARHGMEGRDFDSPPSGRPSGAKAAVEHATDELRLADDELAVLQDSMLPVEVGDAEVRAGLSGVRELIGPLPARARELLRTLGR